MIFRRGEGRIPCPGLFRISIIRDYLFLDPPSTGLFLGPPGRRPAPLALFFGCKRLELRFYNLFKNSGHYRCGNVKREYLKYVRVHGSYLKKVLSYRTNAIDRATFDLVLMAHGLEVC